jgi:hypothetical protein
MNNPDPPQDQPDKEPRKEHREMYTEIAALVASLAKAFAMKESDAAAAVESGAVTFAFSRDANDNPFVAATYGGKTARLYQGAIKRGDAPAN